MPKVDGLTEKQKLFCREYMVDLNATQSAKRAGYSENTAYSIGQENLNKPEIQEYLEKLKRKRDEKVDIKAEEVLREYKRLALFDIRKIYNDNGTLKKISELDDDTAAAIVGLDFDDIILGNKTIGKTTKVKLADKKGSLDSLAKHLGLFEKDNDQLTKKEVVNYDWSSLSLEERKLLRKASLNKDADTK